MSQVVVRGAATAEDIAAVTAVLAARASSERPEDAYTRWRSTRIAALRVMSADGESRPRSR